MNWNPSSPAKLPYHLSVSEHLHVFWTWPFPQSGLPTPFRWEPLVPTGIQSTWELWRLFRILCSLLSLGTHWTCSCFHETHQADHYHLLSYPFLWDWFLKGLGLLHSVSGAGPTGAQWMVDKQLLISLVDGTGSMGNETTAALKVGLSKPSFCNVYMTSCKWLFQWFLKVCDSHLLIDKALKFPLMPTECSSLETATPSKIWLSSAGSVHTGILKALGIL